MLLCWFIAVSILVPDFGKAGVRVIERSDVFKAIVTEVVRVSLSPWWTDAPWPDGLIIARLQSKLAAVDALLLHLLTGSASFALLGFVAGRMGLTTSAIVLPPLLFYVTYAILNASFAPAPPLTPLNLGLISAAQLAAVYVAALWGKWSVRQ